MVVVSALLDMRFGRRPGWAIHVVHPDLARTSSVCHYAELDESSSLLSHLFADHFSHSVVDFLTTVLSIFVGVAVADRAPHAVLAHLYAALRVEVSVRNYDCPTIHLVEYPYAGLGGILGCRSSSIAADANILSVPA